MSEAASSRAMVDLTAYAHNLGCVRELIPADCAILAVVKANAYGHGLIPIARQAVAHGVAMLGVATVEEGIALREAGIEAPILLLVQPAQHALAAAIENGLRPMISDVATAEHIGDLVRKAGKIVPIHCKVDSGMGRQGFEIEQAVRQMLYLTRVSNIDIEGIATHFPVADLSNDPFTINQIRAFKHLLRQLNKHGVPYEMAHAANSAAIMNYPGSMFNMVRPGLMTYGVWPTDTPPVSSPLRRVLRWESRIVLLKQLEAGASIGYGRTYITEAPMRAALIPVGYADGYKHKLSNTADVLIRGQRCPVRGAVSMDQIVADTTHLEEVAVGDRVTLIGTDGDQTITAEELARHAQTIPYDILAGIGPRVQRQYVE